MDPQDDPNYEEFLPADDQSEAPVPETVDWVRKPSKETPEKSKYD